MEAINDILKRVETEHDVKILYACETGSRAWGFPSPDSDYDIRFIYRHDRDWYLKLNEPKDFIESLNGDLDLSGWDLRKALVLLKKSNVALIERFQSPVRYYADEAFTQRFMQLLPAYYSPVASFYHHWSLAGRFWEEMQSRGDVKLKAFFYLVRSLLSCRWIVRDDAVPPMHLEGLLKYATEEEKMMLRELVVLKATKTESYVHPLSAWMQGLITQEFARLETAKANLRASSQDCSLLNDFFLKTLHGNDNA